MHLDWDSLAPLALKGLISLGATLGVWVTILIVKRWRDRPAVRRDPQATMRRRMPLFGPLAGMLIFLFGALIGLIGTTQDADPENGREMMIAGPCMMLLGIILLVLYVIVYVDASPTAFTLRGPLGRTRTIAYEDIATITDTVAWGAPLVQIRSRSGARIQAGPIMFDWHHYQRWQAERERRARVSGWA
ncbi:hypothetical protein Bra3105_10445 [Brachybacterium halotolerans subsp. kimchii]|uniref:hypothetical protein n=1 Tax=Brachybacterium halotolerans TaxID=2795215 RepID=UPI001E615610|nr:hypothetical protein [Brachybacterium halotolerans]UEJ81273.1 hypothetical protein Bra3105_10445 [Brachybacterium halotolerans subsp. kimchii]